VLDLRPHIRPGDGVWWSQAGAEAVPLVDALLDQASAIGGVRAFCGLTVNRRMRGLPDGVELHSYGALGELRAVSRAGRLTVVPAHYSALPRLFAQRLLPGDVGLVQVSPPGPDGRCSFGIGADYAPDAVPHSRVLLGEINHRMPVTAGAPGIDVDRFAATVETDRALPEIPEREPDDVDAAIAARVAALVEDGDTVQMGVGALPTAIMDGLSGHRARTPRTGVHRAGGRRRDRDRARHRVAARAGRRRPRRTARRDRRARAPGRPAPHLEGRTRRMSNRTAFVTGAAQGIGRGIATTLGERGFRVAVVDLNLDVARTTAAAIREDGGTAIAVQADVTDTGSVQAAVKTVTDELGDVEVAVNNAGWDDFMNFVDTTEEFWDRVIDINFKGALRVAHAVVPGMMARGFGRVVNIGSDAGRVGSSLEAVYSGAKGGVIAFTKTLAREVAKAGVTANTVCPGPTDTPMLRAFAEKSGDGAKVLAGMTRGVPMRRLAQPADVAAAVAFFASDEAGYITGQTLSVSGGLTMA
jgi:2-hydroxycyclohexanecarboxyl-CoA dehydrogenase